MWYAICLGIGLLIGIGFLIWALRERSLRHAAESEVVSVKERLGHVQSLASSNMDVIRNLREELNREGQRVAALRRSLDGVLEMVSSSKDPKVIKIWLDAELKEEKVGG